MLRSRYTLAQLALDLVLVAWAWAGAFWLRFNLDLPDDYSLLAWRGLWVPVAAYALALLALRVDRHVWRYAGLPELRQLARALGLGAALTRLVARAGEPVIRRGVDLAMRMMGEQFVTGETIKEALKRAKELEAKGFAYSYDMLGEAATTAADAKRYYVDYEQAIHAIGKASAGRGIYAGPGISIKLSALHPRYVRAQADRVMGELLPAVKKLALLSKSYDIGLQSR